MGLLRGAVSFVGVVRIQQHCRPKIIHTHPHIAAPILLNGFKEENLGAILVDGKADGGCNREKGGGGGKKVIAGVRTKTNQPNKNLVPDFGVYPVPFLPYRCTRPRWWARC